MTTIDELKAACERYRSVRKDGYRYEVLAHEIADAFLDRSPITRERLLELGFEDGSMFEGGLRLYVGCHKLTWFIFRGQPTLAVDTTAVDWIKTLGQFRFLVQSLGDSE